MWEVTYTPKKMPVLQNPLLIEGLPGIGNVGKIVVDYFIEEFEAQHLCSFFSHRFPNTVFVNEENIIELPRLDLYYRKSKGKGRDLLLLSGDIQPIDEESLYHFCATILAIARDIGVKEAVTTGGIGLQNIPDKPKVYCTTNDKGLLKEYTKKGNGVEKHIFGVVGPIIGVSGVLLAMAPRYNIKGGALFAETFSHPLHIGITGAHEILRVLEARFALGLNLKKIKKQIAEMVEAEKEFSSKTKEVVSEMMQAGTRARKSDINYIG